MSTGQVLFLTYAAGVVWGAIIGDAKPTARMGLALLWPIGPLAFVLTVAMLLLAAPVAFLGRGR